MKKLSFALLFFTAIAWLWIGHMMGADGVLQNVSGTTSTSGSSISGVVLTNFSTIAWSNTIGISTPILTVTNAITGVNSVRNFFGTISGDNGIETYNSYATAKSVSVASRNIVLSPSSGGNLLGGLHLARLHGIGWSANNGNGDADVFTSDTALVRGAAASIVNTNPAAALSWGTFTSAALMIPTNYVAANFTPVAGMVKIVSSNGVLYKVTQLSTNLLGPDTP